jgi:hypothetical protein
MVTITYAPLGPQYGAMQSLHYVQDDAVRLNMIMFILVTCLGANFIQVTWLGLHNDVCTLPKQMSEIFEALIVSDAN